MLQNQLHILTRFGGGSVRMSSTNSSDQNNGGSRMVNFRMRLGEDGNWHSVRTDDNDNETEETDSNRDGPIINSSGGATVRSINVTSSSSTNNVPQSSSLPSFSSFNMTPTTGTTRNGRQINPPQIISSRRSLISIKKKIKNVFRSMSCVYA